MPPPELPIFTPIGGHERLNFRQPPDPVRGSTIERKERQMKKTALILATVAALAAPAAAPAEARGFGFHRGTTAPAVTAAAIAATVAADTYGYGPGYYYG